MSFNIKHGLIDEPTDLGLRLDAQVCVCVCVCVSEWGLCVYAIFAWQLTFEGSAHTNCIRTNENLAAKALLNTELC